MHCRRMAMSVFRRRSLLLKLLLAFPTLWFLFVLFVSFQENRKTSTSLGEQPRAVVGGSAPLHGGHDPVGFGLHPEDDTIKASSVAAVLKPSSETLRLLHDGDDDNDVGHQRNDQRTKVDSDQNKAVLVAPREDVDRPGEMGKPVILSKNLTTDLQKEVDKGWQDNAFNQYASDMISLHRSLPDMRDDECKKPGKYLPVSELPDTSVIVCFHNEAWSVLLRTVHSILDRSSPSVLREIILVDDASTMDHLQGQLEDYVKDYPKIKIVRSPQRVGLIRARLFGAARAIGKVLTYLDSHCECTPGWLEPLLDRIARNETTVVCPVIDVIDDSTLEYLHRDATGTNVGGFDWNLQFNWHAVPESEKKRRAHPSDPVWSPTMAGGLFAIDRQYFEHLGTYDSGFDIWGGENLELSFKVWMCGGTLEIIPCSHVGHIFRKRSPYQWRTGVNVLKRNSIRLAEVWLDDYKRYYYQRIGNDLGDFGDVSPRMELRRRLNCHSFDWFLKNIYPELFVPGEAIASGEVRNLGQAGSMCLDSPARKQDLHKAVSMYPCHGQGGNQIRSVVMTSGDGEDQTRSIESVLCLSGSYDEDEDAKNEAIVDVCVREDDEQFWMLSKSGEIRRDEACLDFAGAEVILYPCHGSKGNQHWYYDDSTHTLKHVNSKKCLEMAVDKVKLLMQPCDANNERQRWKFQNYGNTTIEGAKRVFTN